MIVEDTQHILCAPSVDTSVLPYMGIYIYRHAHHTHEEIKIVIFQSPIFRVRHLSHFVNVIMDYKLCGAIVEVV